MRYTRLRRAIESGTLIGTHGTPFQGGADKTAEARKKRKKISGDSDEEGASVDRTPTSGRLALESGSYKSVSDFDEMAQEIESDSVPSAKKQRRASKTPSEAIKSETIGPDAFHFGMNQAVISKNVVIAFIYSLQASNYLPDRNTYRLTSVRWNGLARTAL